MRWSSGPQMILQNLRQQRPSGVSYARQEAPPSTALARSVKRIWCQENSMETHSLIMALISLLLIPDVTMAPINT